MNIYSQLPKPFFALAPLDDVTDVVFRQIVAECASPDIFFTEFVNVDGLQSPGRTRVVEKLRLSAFDKPIIAQIWGKDPENYYKTVKELAAMGFEGVDINMGCPIKAVVNNGCCAALINNRPLAKSIIDAAKAGAEGQLPVSVKTRLGFNEVDFTWHEFLLGLGLDSLTIHGRTKKQLSQVPADWESIGKIREIRDSLSPSTTMIGNGDVVDTEMGRHLAAKYKLDGIMIGRGIFADPFVFAGNSKWLKASRSQKLKLYKKHIHLFSETWGKNGANFNSLKKFAKVYVNNFEGAKELRELLMNANSLEELLTILN